MSETADARAILEMLLESPSNLGPKELTQLKAIGWELLYKASDDLDAIKAVIFPLMCGRKRKPGRRHDSFNKSRHESDLRVFDRIEHGSTVAAAILGEYGDEGFEGHEKRINSGKKTMKLLTEAARRSGQ